MLPYLLSKDTRVAYKTSTIHSFALRGNKSATVDLMIPDDQMQLAKDGPEKDKSAQDARVNITLRYNNCLNPKPTCREEWDWLKDNIKESVPYKPAPARERDRNGRKHAATRGTTTSRAG